MHIEIDGVPVLPWSPPPLLHHLKIRYVMNCPVITLPPVVKVADLINILKSCNHHGFPVVAPDSGDVSSVQSFIHY
jgi:chloride channel 7